MGLVGLLMFATTFVIAVPGDVVVARCVALIFLGWGFGQTDSRTHKLKSIGRRIATEPFWRLTVSSTLLFGTAIGAAIYLVWYLA